MHLRILLSVLLLPFGLAAQDPAGPARLLPRATLTLGEAVQRALVEASSGTAWKAELEEDKGKVVFSIDIAQGEKNCNVVLEATDGKVVEKDVENEDRSAVVRAAKIPLTAAVATALGQHAGGKAVQAGLALQGGKPVYRVDVFAGGTLHVVAIDGVTGQAAGTALAAQPAVPAPAAERDDAFTDTFRIEEGELAATGANPWFRLEPGVVLVLEGKDGSESVRLTVSVLSETKKFGPLETRIVEEREEADGRLKEVSRNYFAISKRSNSVFYFGEEVDIYEDGKVVSHAGAWQHGDKGARFGLLMPGLPLLGARHYQEIAPGVAMDRAVIVGVNETVTTPAGTFEGCVKFEETTPLEKGKSIKVYAPGIGLVQDDALKLVKHGRGAK